ncbi:oligosaccharide flippase family protein [Paraglaciecola sp. L3A3]|uniref:oligosaccharide flippase family protein n=1 Tax=Paraglaciecola sp. L3A3 TaxID=2686358 RepID=UPI00131B7D76|nr:oligosaccharide flippase family protein [Paraglaciecola sp. L3A3]
MSSLKKTLSSSFLLSFETILRKLVGLVSTLVLARLLMPEDFGIIAIALMTMGLLEAMKEFGAGAYLMRSKDINKDMINTSWTIGLISTIVFALILAVSSPLVAAYFEDPRLIPVLCVYATMWLLRSVGNPGTVLLKREQNYLPIVKASIISKVISVVIVIPAAIYFQNYWALVIAQYSMSLTGVISGYIIHPHRPRLCLVNFKEQWKFSSWFLLQSILGYCRSQLDTFLVGSFFDKAALGSYHTMKYLASMPTTFLIGPATEPLLVQLAKIKDTKAYFSQQYNVSLIVPLCLAIPACLFIYYNHALVTHIILGDNWIEYSKLFAIFCISIFTILVQQHALRVLIIHAKTKQIFYFEILSFIGLYGYLLTQNFDEILVFSTSKIAIELLMALLVFIYVTIRYTSVNNLLQCFLCILPVAISAYIASYTTRHIILDQGEIIQFIITTASFGIIYFLSLIIQVMILRNMSREWAYIWNICRKVIIKTLESKPFKSKKI